MGTVADNSKGIMDFLKEKDDVFLDGMRAYIKKLKALSPEEAKKEAEKALFRTGVTDADGNVKEKIVSLLG